MTSFRKIEEKDDITLFATGIYNTDKALYNTLFDNKKTSIKVLEQLITSKYINEYHKDFITIIYDENTEIIKGFILAYMDKQIIRNSTLNAYEEIKEISLSSIILEKVLTHIFATKLGQTDYYIKSLYIFKDYRQKGYGSKLLEKIKQKARLNNARRLLLDIDYENEYLLNFYEKRGFNYNDKNFYDILGKTFGNVGLECEL